MRMTIGLCQIEAAIGDVERNMDRTIECLDSYDADVYVFPELFLTGYGADYSQLKEKVESSSRVLSDTCRDRDCAIVMGAPRYQEELVYNSILFYSPDGDAYYDKIHLARFGIYSEHMFEAGNRPCIAHHHGIGIGFCICYDIFFPETLHAASMNGASLNVCLAASAEQSKPFLDTVLPTRALENVSYMAYVNNIGIVNGLRMHGCSRGLDPFGRTLVDCHTDECVMTFTVDTEDLAEKRMVRRHLEDFRADIRWYGEE